MCAEWVGLYNDLNNINNPDNIPSMKSLVNAIEKLRNNEGKSFLRDLSKTDMSKTTIIIIMKELKEIRLSEWMTAEEYLKTVPEQYRQENISAIYEVLQKGYPMNRGEIQSLVRENYSRLSQKY